MGRRPPAFRIALILILLWSATVLLAFLGILIGRIAVGDLKELTIFMGPLTTTVGVAVHYHFQGSRNA